MYHIHKLNVYVNGIWFLYVHIDDHVFARHGENITTELILKLIMELHFKIFDEISIDNKGFKYFATDISLHGKTYRLVWLLPPDRSYVGIRTAYRKKIKYDN